jgi:hypothetical protein
LQVARDLEIDIHPLMPEKIEALFEFISPKKNPFQSKVVCAKVHPEPSVDPAERRAAERLESIR